MDYVRRPIPASQQSTKTEQRKTPTHKPAPQAHIVHPIRIPTIENEQTQKPVSEQTLQRRPQTEIQRRSQPEIQRRQQHAEQSQKAVQHVEALKAGVAINRQALNAEVGSMQEAAKLRQQFGATPQAPKNTASLENSLRRPNVPLQRGQNATLAGVAEHFIAETNAMKASREPQHNIIQRIKAAGGTLVKYARATNFNAPELAAAIQRFIDPVENAAARTSVFSAIGTAPSLTLELQRALAASDENLEMQRKALQGTGDGEDSQTSIADQIAARVNGGQPLPVHIRKQLELHFNTNLSKVRIHTDGTANELSKKVNALAFTTGNHIFFQAGQYNPDSPSGFELLAHEVTHTLQQSQGQVGAGIDANPSLEAAAVQEGQKAASNKSTLEQKAQSAAPNSFADFAGFPKPLEQTAQPETTKPTATSSVQRLVAPSLQRTTSQDKIEQAVAALFKAMDGIGTDEAAIMRALSGKTAFELKAIQDTYKARYNRSLKADLEDELSGDDLSKALALLNAVGANPIRSAPAAASSAVQDAKTLRTAMAGVGTDEAAIHRVFAGKTPQQIKLIRDTYEKTYTRDLKADLEIELSGADLQKALKALSVVGARATVVPTAGQSYQINQNAIAAGQLHDAMAGVGTDEAKILRILKGKTPAQLQAIQAEYQKKYKTSLLVALRNELSGDELSQALQLLGAGDAKVTFSKEINAAADKLFKATDGHGTDETAIYDVLENKTPEQIKQIIAAYRDHYRRDLEADLRSELNADEFAVVLPALRGKGLPANRAKSALARLYDSIHWYGDDEDQIEETLAKLSPAEIQELRNLAKNNPQAKAKLDRVLSNLGGTDLAVTKALISGDKATASAARIAQAIEGLGTNEAKVYKYLQEKVDQYLETDVKPALETKFANNPAQLKLELEKARQSFLKQIQTAYKAKTGRTLTADIADDFSGAEKDQANALAKGDKAAASAARIQEAAEGWGTNEAAITAELKGKSQEERAEIMAKFAKQYGAAYKPQFTEQFIADYRAKQQKAFLDQYMAQRPNQNRQQLLPAALQAFNQKARAEAEKAFDPSDPKKMQQVILAMFNDELSGTDLVVANQNLNTGKTDDDLALQIAIEGAGTDEAAIKEILKGKSKAEIQAIGIAYKKRTGRDLQSDLFTPEWGFAELDGRDAFEAKQALEGTPVTAEDFRRQAAAREAFERSDNSTFSSFWMGFSEKLGFTSKGSQLDDTTQRVRSMFQEVRDSNGKITYTLKPEFTQEDVARVAAYQQTDTQNYIEAKTTVTEALKTGGEILVAALVTVLTEGAASPWLVAALSGIAGTATGIGIQYGMDSNAYGKSSISVDALKGALETALTAGLAKGLPISNAIEEMAVKFGDQFTKNALRKLATSVVQKSTTAAINGAGKKTIDNILNDDNWRKGAAEYFQAIFVDAGIAGVKSGLSTAATTVLKDFATTGLSKAEIKNALIAKASEKAIENSVSEAANYINNLLEGKDNQRFEDILGSILQKTLKDTVKGLGEDQIETFVLTTRFKILANVAINNSDQSTVTDIIVRQVQTLNLQNSKYEDVLKNLDQRQISALMLLVNDAKQKTKLEELEDIRERIKTNNPEGALLTPDLRDPPPATQTQQQVPVQRDRLADGMISDPSAALNLVGGTALEPMRRNSLEAHFNTDLGDIRIHQGTDANTRAKALGANAFTQANHIVLGENANLENDALLAHEVSHSLQQRDGKVEKGIDQSPELEDQATAAGTAFTQRKPRAKRTGVQAKSSSVAAPKPETRVVKPESAVSSEKPIATKAKPSSKAKKSAKPIADEPVAASKAKPASKGKQTPKTAKSPAANNAVAATQAATTQAPAAMQANIKANTLAFAPIPKLEEIDPKEQSKLLKEQDQSIATANSTLQNLRKHAKKFETHSAKLTAQIKKAATTAKTMVSQSGSQQKQQINNQMSALIAQARAKGQASIAKSNADAKAKIASLPGITNAAKQAITSNHQQTVTALKAKLEAQRPLITQKYEDTREKYVAAAQPAGAAANSVATARAETHRSAKTDEGWLEKAASYTDFGAGPHPNDVLDARADADIQTGKAYASPDGYTKAALEAFEESKAGIPQDFENIKTAAYDPLEKVLLSTKDNAIKALEASERSTKQQLEQTRAQMESAMKAQLEGVVQQLTGQKTSLVSTIDAIIKQSISGIDTQSSSQIQGVQKALRSAAGGVQKSIDVLETQMRGKRAPKPAVLKKMLRQIEKSVTSTVQKTLNQTSKSVSTSSKEFANTAKTSVAGMRSTTQQGLKSAKQSEQQLIQSLTQLVQSAATAYTNFQTSHKTSSTQTQTQTITEFTRILTGSDTAFKTALDSLADSLEKAAKGYGEGLLEHANSAKFTGILLEKEATAAKEVAPRWKSLVKILLIIVVIVVVALVIGPAVIGAVGAFAASAVGAGALATAIGAIVGGAIVGALSGAVIQMGNNAIDGKNLLDGVGQAMISGAISGAVGGGLGAAFAGGANAAAMSSRSVLQAIGTKANSYAGKMVLDQLNGVISGQFTSLVTTGKFQSFSDMLKDPSTYIGFATSAATTRGGGPTRANTNAADVNAPKVNVDVNAPKVNVDVPNAPRANADAPVAAKPSRIEAVQNRIEGIQNRFTKAGERVGQTAGVRVTDAVGIQAKIPTRENPSLKPGEQRIVTNDGQTRIEIAPGTKDTVSGKTDLEVHRETAVQDIRNGRTSTRQGELALETAKHRDMAAWRLEEAAKLPDGSPEKLRLLSEATDYIARANEYEKMGQAANPKKGSGTGEINAKNGIHNENFKADAGVEVTKSIQDLELPNGKKYKTIDELLVDYDLTTANDGNLQLRQRSVDITDDNALRIRYDATGKPIAIEPASTKPVKRATHHTDSDLTLTGDKAVDTNQAPYRDQTSAERSNVSSGKQNEDYNKGRSRKAQEKATAEKTGGENYTDTPEWKQAHAGMIEQTRLIGEEAAHAFIKGHFGEQAELVYGGPNKGSSSGDFDQVWKVTKADGSIEYIVVEAKGGSAQLGSREAGNPDYRFQQGTPEYFESVRNNMSRNKKDGLAQRTGDDLQVAMQNGQVRYLHVETPIVKDASGQAVIGKTSVREFDLSIRPTVDATTTSNTAPVVRPTTEPGTTAPKPATNPVTTSNSIHPNTKTLVETNPEQVTRLQEYVKDPLELESWLSIPGVKPDVLERIFTLCQDHDVSFEQFKDIWAFNKPTPEQLADRSFKWPINDGALGEVQRTEIASGTLIDRYGATRGSFVSPAGYANATTKTFEYTKYSHAERALPAAPNEADYHVYLIVKPITADKAIAAPWFGELGGATQFKLSDGNIQKYLDSGDIIEIPVSKLQNPVRTNE